MVATTTSVQPTGGLATMTATSAQPAAQPTAQPTAQPRQGGFNIGAFLTEGSQIPQGSALRATQSQTVLPQFYTDYAKQILANQQAASQIPFQLPPMPRVAEFSPAQQQAFQMTGQAATAHQPMLNAAMQSAITTGNASPLAAAQPLLQQAAGVDVSGFSNQLTAAGGRDTSAAASPYFSQAMGIDPRAAAAGDFTGARGALAQAQQADITGAASPFLQQAASLNGVTAAAPAMQQALGTAGRSLAPMGMDAANPFLQRAGQNATDVSAYLDPYITEVADRAGQLGARTLRERLLPEIEGRYISAGQLGFGSRNPGVGGTPSGQMVDTTRALRDMDETVRAQQADLLSRGYAQAQAAAQTDLARQGQLASTAGQLGTAQQRALLDAAGLQATVGGQMGQLTQAQQAALSQIGRTYGDLATAQQRGALDAANVFASLGRTSADIDMNRANLAANIGGQLGQLSAGDASRAVQAAGQAGQLALGQQQNLSSIGGQLGSLTNQQNQTNNQYTQQLAQLAQLNQQLGLTGAGALGNVGQQQQNQAQQNLNVAYEDFLRQQGYPQQQIDAMLKTFQGVAPGIPTGSQTFGVEPTGQPAQFQPGTASTIAGALTGAAGILNALGVGRR